MSLKQLALSANQAAIHQRPVRVGLTEVPDAADLTQTDVKHVMVSRTAADS